jgi:hypothetical protein
MLVGPKDQDLDDDFLTVYTPLDIHDDKSSSLISSNQSRENLNVLLMYDDAVYVDFLIQSMRAKGVRIVNFPTISDHASIIPFLLSNDHSIVVFRNPKKELLPMLKMIIRRGAVKYKEPINVNLTIWVLIDVLNYIEKGVKNVNEKRPPKKL